MLLLPLKVVVVAELWIALLILPSTVYSNVRLQTVSRNRSSDLSGVFKAGIYSIVWL